MSIKKCSLKSLLVYDQIDRPTRWGDLFSRNEPLVVEIGFGTGEVLIRMAREHRGSNFVGIEQHWERIHKTLRDITKNNCKEIKCSELDNIRILKVDARVAFERLFTQKSINNIYCLFPCPWPKKGHIKHRLFSNFFLRLLNSRLKARGELKIVTDFEPYCEWVLEQSRKTGFQVETQIIKPQYDTKFERKWMEEGKERFYELKMLKKRHINVLVKEDVTLKSYKLKDFCAQRMQFENDIGEISVICKDVIYDSKRKAMLVYVIVSEPDLMQHFRITIFKKGDFWRVCKADGQVFFPTPGIARALQVVYEAACKTVN